MKTSLGKIILIILLAVGLLGAVQAVWFAAGKNRGPAAVEKTRQQLRQAGFKTDLSEFNFSTSTADRSREAAITFYNGAVHQSAADEKINFLAVTANDSALVIWKQDSVKIDAEATDWMEVRGGLAGNWLLLDEACAATLSGPIRFDLDAKRGSAMLLRHLAPLKHLSQSLGVRTALELHDGHPAAAWTNLLAQARLVTAWDIEPVTISHLVRFSLTGIAFNTAWQALQNQQWSEQNLATLQREWATLNFFTNLPLTAAFERANAVQGCEWVRQDKDEVSFPWMDLLKEAKNSPVSAWRNGKYVWELKRYRYEGVFDDEKNLLLYFQTNELNLRDAVTARNWQTMKLLPGATNPTPFFSPHRSRVQSMLNMRVMSLAMQSQGASLLARAAEAETRRRIILTAIALERFRHERGAYPKSLSELPEKFLSVPPVDFMDGQPLRYRLADDGRFSLYSVGLDGVDDGGKLPEQSGDDNFLGSPARYAGSRSRSGAGTVRATDIVWPRPATTNEVAALLKQELADLAASEDVQEMSAAAQQWSSSVVLQADVEKILARPPDESINATQVNGKLLSALLQPPNRTGTNALTLLELLTLRPVAAEGAPERVTFDLPLNYAAVTNLGQLTLLVDSDPKNISEAGVGTGQVELHPAADGNCRLVWNTIYESPGQHALLLMLSAAEPDGIPPLSRTAGMLPPPRMPGVPGDFEDVVGPAASFFVSNLCEFSFASAHYNTNTAAILHAKLPEANARYTIELTTTNGTRLKTITGTTANGEIRERWDLLDAQGQRFTGDGFNSVFQITLPDSGRTQTLKGP
jgi:hypothetical protein